MALLPLPQAPVTLPLFSPLTWSLLALANVPWEASWQVWGLHAYGVSVPATDHCSRKAGQHMERVTQTSVNPGPLWRWQPATELPNPVQPKMLMDVIYFSTKKMFLSKVYDLILSTVAEWKKAKMVRWRFPNHFSNYWQKYEGPIPAPLQMNCRCTDICAPMGSDCMLMAQRFLISFSAAE